MNWGVQPPPPAIPTLRFTSDTVLLLLVTMLVTAGRWHTQDFSMEGRRGVRCGEGCPLPQNFSIFG